MKIHTRDQKISKLNQIHQKIKNTNYDAVLTLQPTSPFRQTATIDKCIQLMATSESIDSVITVSNIEGYRPEWMLKIDSTEKVTPYATPFELNGNPSSPISG